MAKVVPAVEEKVKRAIRDFMAKDPIATQNDLLAYLEDRFAHRFDHRYIAKLAKKILQQARTEADREQLIARLTQLRETYRVTRAQLVSIIHWEPGSDMPRPSCDDIIHACRSLVRLDLAVLNAELANELYRKPIKSESFTRSSLSPERRKVILDYFEMAGVPSSK